MATATPIAPTIASHAASGPLRHGVWTRLVQAIRAVLASEIGGRFRLMFGGILALLLAISGLNVVSSYVGRDLMTAIEQRSHSAFVTMALLYVLVFTALTVAAAFVRFIEERLALLWRTWLTRDLVQRYLDHGAYLRLREAGDLGNPDQRIADDARSFTGTTLSFALIFINAVFAIVAFSGVMWSISRLLFVVAVAYAALGSLFTVVLGRPLVRLNYDQSDREASFRTELVHVGENAEAVALLQLERRLAGRLSRRIDALVANAQRIITVHRNLSFFTTGYAYGIQLLPALIVGPLFMRGAVDFGVITQSAMAFAHLLGAFSLIVTQIQQLSSYAAVLVRLGRLTAAVENASAAERPPSVELEGPERIVFDDVTLRSRGDGELLVAHLTVTIPAGTRLLVTGTDQARRALFRATALGRDAATGVITRPPPARIHFLPERPHLPPGTLRELLSNSQELEQDDERLGNVLDALGLKPALERVGGLDADGDWGHSLSLSEQQLLAFGRVLLSAPAFVLMQSPGTTIAPEQLARVLRRLEEAQITYIAFGDVDASPGAYDAVLELHAGGTWSFRRS